MTQPQGKKDCKPYIPIIVDNTFVLAFLDTGAHISLMSADFWDSIPHSQRSPLQKNGTTALSVTGEPIDCIGTAVATVHLGCQTVKHPFFIARNISHSLLLGWDFFTKHKATISSDSSTFNMPGVTIPLADRHQYQMPLHCNVALIGQVTIPAKSEMHVQGRLLTPQPDILPHDYDGMFEPTLQEHFNIAGARSLSRPQEGIILVRLLNPLSESVELPANANLGQFHSTTGNLEEEYEIIDGVIASTQKPTKAAQVPDMLSSSELTKEQYAKAEQLLTSYADVFSSSSDDIGQTDFIQHHISTTAETPIHQRAYRTSPKMRVEIQTQVNELLDRGIVEESFSPWASPIVMVKKKDNTFRFCVDYRALNAITIRDSHPIPRQDDSIDALSSSSFFSVIDLSSGYWQVKLNPLSKEKTAFTTGSGLYQFTVMPFGLVNAPMTFQRLMESVLNGLHWSTCLVYLDDCIIMGRTFDEHLSNLQEVLQRFRQANLKLKPSKCQFFKKEVTYLGYVIGSEGVLPDPNNIEKVSKWPVPRNVTEVRSFLGLASFYRRFIPKFSQIASPLTDLTHKGTPFAWTPECNEAFNNLKTSLTHPPLLAYPDFNLEFNLSTDASLHGIGAILSQQQGGRDRVVSYFSQKLTETQRKWSTFDRELWAMVAAIRHFRHFLRGQQFTIYTDHQPLSNFKKISIQDDATGRRARWIAELGSYSFTILHRRGKHNGNADALSRLPKLPVTSVITRSQSRQEETQGEESTMSPPSSPTTAETMQGEPIPGTTPTRETTSQPHRFSLGNQEFDLLTHQQQDADLKTVIEVIKKGEKPTAREIKKQHPRLRRLLWELPHLTLHNDILHHSRNNEFGKSELQPVVPESLVLQVLEELHGHPSSGHFGLQRTLQRAKATCYWPFMYKDISDHCSTCVACESLRAPNPKHQAPLQNIVTDHPLQLVFADIAELPTSRRGYRYILVLVDHFSKYINIYPMKDQTAQTVTKFIFEDYIAEHGIPEAIHTDQGRQFEARLMQDLCERLNIRKSRSTPYHPQGAGLVERVNRVIKEQLARYIADKRGDWDAHIPQVQLAYNSSTHSTTGLTPYMVMHGREARVPANITCPIPQHGSQSPLEYVADLHKRLKDAYNYVQEKSGLAQQLQKRAYDKKERSVEYLPGDLVWLHDPVHARHKLEPNWTGPYSILASLHDGLNYQIEDIHNPNRKKVVHHNRLKIFRRREPLKHTPPSSQPSSIGRQTRPSDCTLPSSFSNQEQPSDCTLPSSFTSPPGPATIEWVLEPPGHQPQPLNQPDENGDGQPLTDHQQQPGDDGNGDHGQPLTDHQRQADGSRDGDGQHLTDHRQGDDRMMMGNNLTIINNR